MSDFMLAEPSDPAEVQVCKRLWASVFRVGVEDAVNNTYNARYWLDSNDHHVGSFVWLCHIFGYDPDYIRSFVKGHYKEYQL